MWSCLKCVAVQVLRKGQGLSTRPTPQCRVKVRTSGSLESGELVDRHSALWFTVGDGDVIQGIDRRITRCISICLLFSLGHGSHLDGMWGAC